MDTILKGYPADETIKDVADSLKSVTEGCGVLAKESPGKKVLSHSFLGRGIDFQYRGFERKGSVCPHR
jgi:hypothetical protein